ncbi:MAG: MgtC/SapB family protein [Clostridia bacterium]|nr:MgtC/SapB family protein [Clostridia bacterium]
MSEFFYELTDFIQQLEEFSFISIMVRMLLATLIGGTIGLERSKRGRSAGMRTHILVCLGASLTALMGYYLVEHGFSSDPARIAAQVISGIGFLGAGIILFHNKFKIVGLTTAAGLWITAILGLCCGFAFFEGALLGFAIAMVTALFLPKIEYWFSKNDKYTMIYMEMHTNASVNRIYDILRNSNFGEIHKIEIVSPKSGNSEHIGIEFTLTLQKKSNIYNLEKTLCAIEGIVFAVEL